MTVYRASASVVISCLLAMTLSASGRSISDLELRHRMECFDSAIEGQARDVRQAAIRELAKEMLRTEIRVSSGIVASTYERHNESNIYFGTNSEPADHLYLSGLDPDLDSRFREHRFWVSVIRTFPDRQLSFELPIDRTTFDSLQSGQEIAFSCTLAALIRGKSVYCWPTRIELDHRTPDHGP